ncbi:hypothetical protein VNO77_37369 [Canavalia gladiata]|uniref:Uncharacterized protein n=1 Tax=Canavalia gladiata TaxID=3824 RepID=A0AAN9KAS0_CANGL
MATKTLLKLKPNLNLPLRFLRNPASVLTRSLAPITRPEASTLFQTSTFPLPGMFARQMGTNRSPRVISRREEEEEEDLEDDEDEFDVNDEFEDLDGDDLDNDEEEEEEEEKPRGNKTYGKKWMHDVRLCYHLSPLKHIGPSTVPLEKDLRHLDEMKKAGFIVVQLLVSNLRNGKEVDVPLRK